MKARLKQFFTDGRWRQILLDTEDSADGSQMNYRSIFIISTIVMIAMIVIAALNWYDGSPSMFVSSAALSVIFFITNLMIYKRMSLKLIATIICVVLAVVFSFFIISGGNEGFAITWVFLVPCSISLLFGMRAGLLISGYFLVFFCVSFYTPLHQYFPYEYPSLVLSRFPILYICYFLINTVIQVQLKNLRLNQMEAQREVEAAARAKSDFLAKMSHEIRTPMNAVMGLSELVLRKELPQDAYENVLMIRNASTNLLAIINDILDFSKIESGKLEILDADYLFPSLMNDVVNIIRVRLADKPVHMAVSIDPSIPSLLTGDETRIRQILINLLGNALKYTHKGYVALTVTGAAEENGTITLTIVVEDSGVGIKAEDMDKLFGDFVQLDPEKTKGIEGTGLGLAIARSLCRAMGGDITVRSEYGKGSTFTIHLPQKAKASEPFACVSSPEDKSVLLYEPRTVYRGSILKALHDLGVKCHCVDSLPELLDAAHAYAFVFISSPRYTEVQPALAGLADPPKAVLLADISETLAPKEARTLNLPAHSLSIANILNDVAETHGELVTVGASFTAPEAKILLVDDITANLKVAEGLMLPYEMQITLCTNGREAVELISRNRYDIVFMDHMMPEMDGLEATQAIRGRDGDYYQSLPIVALTANAVAGMREMYLQNGMNDFLTKPIEMVKLNAILEKWIPKDKRKKAKAAPSDIAESPFVEAARAIPELSVQKAMTRTGASVAAYERTLKLSVRMLPENIANLNTYIVNDLARYRIEVHGVKSILNSIGAYALGAAAYELEKQAGAGDAQSCQDAHPAFADRLTAFSSAMNVLLAQHENSGKQRGDLQTLAQALPELEDAIGFFDCVKALGILEPLLQYTYSPALDQTASELMLCLQRMDLDAAEEWLGKLREETASAQP